MEGAETGHAHSRCTMKVAVIAAKVDGLCGGGGGGGLGTGRPGAALSSTVQGWEWPFGGCSVPGYVLVG